MTRALPVDDGIIDDIAIERAMHGDPVPLTPAERLEAVRRMTDRGWSASQIGQRIGCDKRSVVRWRSVVAALDG
jgi:hypothetical protein